MKYRIISSIILVLLIVGLAIIFSDNSSETVIDNSSEIGL